MLQFSCILIIHPIEGLMVGGEALFFETTDPDGYQNVAKKIGGSRGGELSIAGISKYISDFFC